MATGVHPLRRHAAERARHPPDGQRLSIEFSVALLRDDAGQIVGISAIMREVTERRNAERALRTKIAELENRAGPA